MGAAQWREWGANGVSAKKGRKALFDVSFGRRSLLGCEFGMRADVPSLECLGLPRMRSVLVRAHSGPSRPEWVCMVPERRSCARRLPISKPAMRKNTHEQSGNLGSGPWNGSGGCPERPSCNRSSFYYNWNRRVLCDDGSHIICQPLFKGMTVSLNILGRVFSETTTKHSASTSSPLHMGSVV